jgi:hypothetical protein
VFLLLLRHIDHRKYVFGVACELAMFSVKTTTPREWVLDVFLFLQGAAALGNTDLIQASLEL